MNVIIVTAQVHTPIQYDLAEVVHTNDGALIGKDIGLNEIVTSPGNELESFISEHFVCVKFYFTYCLTHTLHKIHHYPNHPYSLL